MKTEDMIIVRSAKRPQWTPMTQKIISIKEGERGVCVVFKEGPRNYSAGNVVALHEREEIEPKDIEISVADKRQYAQRIYRYKSEQGVFYRLEYSSGFVSEYAEHELSIRDNALRKREVRRIFDYLKAVAAQGVLKTEGKAISLADKYEKIVFLPTDTALAAYLSATNNRGGKVPVPLLFPFHSNESQMVAVANAFSAQISVIQGPPGTGKTQTILNIVANIIAQNKTVLIVSNNNSAIDNVEEKFRKEGLDFVIAKLGRSENRNDFIESGQRQLPAMSGWGEADSRSMMRNLGDVNERMRVIFESRNRLAEARQELKALDIEGEHYVREKGVSRDSLDRYRAVSSGRLLELMVNEDMVDEIRGDVDSLAIARAIRGLMPRLRSYIGEKRLVGIGGSVPASFRRDIRALFYVSRARELRDEIGRLEKLLQGEDADALMSSQGELSMRLLHNALLKKYMPTVRERETFVVDDLYHRSDVVVDEYPVVLSTTFSAATTLGGVTFDFVIVDEASQVSVEAGALALSRGRRAVIVGDLMQLPNIVSGEARAGIEKVNAAAHVPEAYDCLENSFLASVTKVFGDCPSTLLREHYRCDPMIIGFCNTKFYGGKLIVMTEGGTAASMRVVRTVEGNHARREECDDGHVSSSNRREVDELKALLRREGKADIGVISPYRGQVELMRRELGEGVEVDTIHKFQGREKDVIVLSTVKNAYDEFTDDPNLVNVAVSRARKEFILITNGNDDETAEGGNLRDLIRYIDYNHGEVRDSDLHSIFDLLYGCYAQRRQQYIARHGRVSGYDSENITYGVIRTILARNPDMANLHVWPNYSLQLLIRDTSGLSEAEAKFVVSGSHVDFLIVNRCGNVPVLAIEVDGALYHSRHSRQRERDALKDGLLTRLGLPVLRLSTTGSGEVERIEGMIRERVGG